MLSCKQSSQLVSKSLDRPLTWRERFAVRLHLLICVYCRRYASQLRWIRKQLAALQNDTLAQTDVTLSIEAKERIARQMASIKPDSQP